MILIGVLQVWCNSGGCFGLGRFSGEVRALGEDGRAVVNAHHVLITLKGQAGRLQVFSSKVK